MMHCNTCLRRLQKVIALLSEFMQNRPIVAKPCWDNLV